MVVWSEHDGDGFADYEMLMEVGDAITFISTGAIVVDFPDNPRKGLLLFMDPEKNIREPNHNNSRVSLGNHYYQKIGGLREDKLAKISNLDDDGGMTWGSFLADYQYIVKFDESTREYFGKVYEDKYA